MNSYINQIIEKLNNEGVTVTGAFAQFNPVQERDLDIFKYVPEATLKEFMNDTDIWEDIVDFHTFLKRAHSKLVGAFFAYIKKDEPSPILVLNCDYQIYYDERGYFVMQYSSGGVYRTSPYKIKSDKPTAEELMMSLISVGCVRSCFTTLLTGCHAILEDFIQLIQVDVDRPNLKELLSLVKEEACENFWPGEVYRIPAKGPCDAARITIGSGLKACVEMVYCGLHKRYSIDLDKEETTGPSNVAKVVFLLNAVGLGVQTASCYPVNTRVICPMPMLEMIDAQPFNGIVTIESEL